MINSDSVSEFVQLNRTFHELPMTEGNDDEPVLEWGLGSARRLSWSDVTPRFRTIILSEAGAGKTSEIRHIAATMRTEGKEAFFLRLEHISANFESAFEVGDLPQFMAWLASNNEGWLFLDSIDEARLRHPGDFHLAIRILGHRIVNALQRTHIIITGRTTAWRPKSDLNHCISHLPLAQSTKANVRDANQHHTNVGSNAIATANEPRTLHRTAFTILAFDDLNVSQVTTFAVARGVTKVEAFLNAIERADAWSFTTRPQDLEELTDYWRDCGRIGTRSEVMEKSVSRRLAERDQERAEGRSLSPERARNATKLIAGAVLLTKNSAIAVPDGTSHSRGLSLAEILPDWSDTERSTLLLRPIFDEAIYGTVQFHHRVVREYLAAEWLADLLIRDTSRRRVDALLFRKQYGIDVVVPTARAVLPWLALRDEKTCQRLRQIAPEVLLESGDPSKLPLETRRLILRQVCQQLADGHSSGSIGDYGAVQRFATDDLAGDVKDLLRLHASNDHLAAFLLRMVWLGELRDTLPEAKHFASSASASRYTRIIACRAVRAVGTSQDMEDVRNSLPNAVSKVDRDLLAELLDGLEPNPAAITWLFACVRKCATQLPYKADRLTDAVSAFFQRAPMELFQRIIPELNRLLGTAPLVDTLDCAISLAFSWLLPPALRMLERLLAEHHPFLLENESLKLLHRVQMASRGACPGFQEDDSRLGTFVSEWPEINRKLFWFAAGQIARQRAKESREPFTEHWQVAINTWCSFGIADFQYAIQEVSCRSRWEERRLALSLAFHLYVIGGRDPKQRRALKSSVNDDAALAACLSNYLRPPKKGGANLTRRIARMKRRAEQWKIASEKGKEDWKAYLASHLDALRGVGLAPGEMTNCQRYVLDRLRESDNRDERWFSGDWRCLLPEFGLEVCQAFRDGAMRFWRGYSPALQSEGALPNSATFHDIFGLVGITIEANETTQLALRLSESEVRLACRYATYELNGFPLWLPSLAESHAKCVLEVFLGEMQYELRSGNPDSGQFYVLDDMSSCGQWLWDQLAPCLFDIVSKREPRSVSQLERVLRIIQGSSLDGAKIAQLASRKCASVRRTEHLARWFGVWVGVDPDSAISALEQRLAAIRRSSARTKCAMSFVTGLLGTRGSPTHVRSAFKTPRHLQRLYLLMHEHIKASDDIDRVGAGAYSPGLRDEAQEARNGLAELIRRIPGKEAFVALSAISQRHPDGVYRAWFEKLSREKAENDADIFPWTVTQVREFQRELERTPGSTRELAEMVRCRLVDLKDDLEDGDSSVASLLRGAENEREVRKFIGREMRDKSHGRYSVPQEEELADGKKPDLRFHGCGFDGVVPCELKVADKWNGPELVERLENQLCGDYLRDCRSTHGVFLVVFQGVGKRRWKLPGNKKSVDFSDLVVGLAAHWNSIAINYPGIEQIEVIGIDLTKRMARSD